MDLVAGMSVEAIQRATEPTLAISPELSDIAI